MSALILGALPESASSLRQHRQPIVQCSLTCKQKRIDFAMSSPDTTPFLLLMPSYNQSQYITEAVRSILAQDDQNWELWIVDNSTDNTPQVMRSFADDRIHYHHIPTRMDPGACLNWMLSRARGRCFSYVHTDNNLQPSYVRRMREALDGHRLSLAYCDMRVIDETGELMHLFRRGQFDLARLLSTDTLGVPFAATTELAGEIGGFSEDDVTDDIRFCISTWGLAKFVYVPDLLLDYRLHGNSRTTNAGGSSVINNSLPLLMKRVESTLQKQGYDPVRILATAIRQSFDELDHLVEDLWLRKLRSYCNPWWQGNPKIEYFVLTGLLSMPGMDEHARSELLTLYADNPQRIGAVPGALTAAKLRWHLKRIESDMEKTIRRLRHMLPSWATLSAHMETETNKFRIGKIGFRTYWTALQLQELMNWTLTTHKTLTPNARATRWQTSNGTEPLLDCEDDILLICEQPAIRN